jgi:RNA polymerase sigma-70 factor (ECF subfamily)
MPEPEPANDLALLRDYLLILARMQVPGALRARIDPSDLVQETLLHAHRDRDQFQGTTTAQTAGWLRKILSCRLIDRMRRESLSPCVSLDQALDRSSARLAEFLAADQSTPSARLSTAENELRVARLLARLSEAQAEALVLRHCEGWPVEKIGRHMGRSPVAVGGLLRHGITKLRALAEDAT